MLLYFRAWSLLYPVAGAVDEEPVAVEFDVGFAIPEGAPDGVVDGGEDERAGAVDKAPLAIYLDFAQAFAEGTGTIISGGDDKDVQEVTIIPRGMSGGMTAQIDRKHGDSSTMTREEMLDEIKFLMGGRAAEKIVYGKEEKEEEE